eukprot:SAG31_NODE_330_length_17593_cov_4.817891_16_plen_92_part_00
MALRTSYVQPESKKITSRDLDWTPTSVQRIAAEAMPIGMNFIATFVGVGGFLLGYDVGIVSGVLTMPTFKAVFKYDDWEMGYIVSSFVAGC